MPTSSLCACKRCAGVLREGFTVSRSTGERLPFCEGSYQRFLALYGAPEMYAWEPAALTALPGGTKTNG